MVSKKRLRRTNLSFSLRFGSNNMISQSNNKLQSLKEVFGTRHILVY